MQLDIIDIGAKIHETPLEEIYIDSELNKIIVEFDDINENRWKVSFGPCQGFKKTTIDCFDTTLLSINGEYPRSLLKVNNSSWLREMNLVLKQKDPHATFMDKSIHYILPFQDDILEIAAWGILK